ncbi:MAG: hypothetical protein J6C03_02400 [Clostridia bacterium]|nr:hypothetical protein [Clostridia bacterium]
MKNRKKGRLRQFTRELQSEIKKNKNVFAVYVTLRILVIAVAVVSLISGHIENFFLCVLSLVLFLLPAFVERKLKVDLPDALEIIVLLFIFAAEILGEISSFYVRVPHWDTMLHTVNGFLFAAIGFAMVDVLNRSSRVKFNLSPFYLAVMAFCFSMTVGVLWEFFEFGMDMLIHFDMQKDTIVNSVTSVTFDTTASNNTVTFKDIVDTVIITSDGSQYAFSDYGVNGYVDIGIIDTMKDLIVNFIGAVVFSIVGFFYVKSRGKGKIARNLIPTLNDSENDLSQ